MANNKNLILFTSHYPMLSGEEFLELEVEFLSSGFQKIIIINSHYDKEMRNVPDNVFVRTINFNKIKVGRFRKFMALITPEFYYILARAFSDKNKVMNIYSEIMNKMRIVMKFKEYNQNQQSLIPPSIKEFL